MIFPVIELIDRLVIAEIKFEKFQSNWEELSWYREQSLSLDLESVHDEIAALKQIHLTIWDLESDLKSFNEQKHSLEEIGRRAITIRNLNHQRILLKNSIASALGCKVRELKHDHASE